MSYEFMMLAKITHTPFKYLKQRKQLCIHLNIVAHFKENNPQNSKYEKNELR